MGKSDRSLLTDAAFVVFIVTIAAYGATYFFESGYFDRLGVPWAFVAPEGKDVIGALMWGLVANFPSLVALALAVWFLALLRAELVERQRKMRAAFGWQSRLDCALAWAAKNYPLLRFGLPAAALGISWIRFSGTRAGPFFFDGWLFAYVLLGAAWLVSFYPNYRGQLLPHALEIFAYLSFFIVTSLGAGSYAASQPSKYPVLDSSPSTVVLGVYSDKFLTARLDTKTGCLEGEFQEISSLNVKVHPLPTITLYPDTDKHCRPK